MQARCVRLFARYCLKKRIDKRVRSESLLSVTAGAAFPARLFAALVAAPCELVGNAELSASAHYIGFGKTDERRFDLQLFAAADEDRFTHSFVEALGTVRVSVSGGIVAVSAIIDHRTAAGKRNARGAGKEKEMAACRGKKKGGRFKNLPPCFSSVLMAQANAAKTTCLRLLP